MSAANPIEFTKRLANGNLQRVGNQVFVINEEGNQVFLVDEYGGLVVTDFVHSKVHEGLTWVASYKTPDASPVADNGNVTFLIQVGDEDIHAVWAAKCGGDCEVAFYSDPTIVAAGTPAIVSNLKTYAGNPVPATVTHTPNLGAVGTIRFNEFEPGGTGPSQSPGGTARPQTEWNLEANHNFVLRAINRAGSAQPMSIVFQFYRE